MVVHFAVSTTQAKALILLAKARGFEVKDRDPERNPEWTDQEKQQAVIFGLRQMVKEQVCDDWLEKGGNVMDPQKLQEFLEQIANALERIADELEREAENKIRDEHREARR